MFHPQTIAEKQLWLITARLQSTRLVMTAGFEEKLPIIYHKCRYRARLRGTDRKRSLSHQSLPILIKFRVTLVMDRRYSLS